MKRQTSARPRTWTASHDPPQPSTIRKSPTNLTAFLSKNGMSGNNRAHLSFLGTLPRPPCARTALS